MFAISDLNTNPIAVLYKQQKKTAKSELSGLAHFNCCHLVVTIIQMNEEGTAYVL